jgi:hypothetical protein
MYQWKRFWCPRTGTFNLADGGYLVDPESEHAKWFGSDAAPFSKIVEAPCLALLGEPGIGKSTAIASARDTIAQALTKTGDRLLWIDLREYGDEAPTRTRQVPYRRA